MSSGEKKSGCGCLYIAGLVILAVAIGAVMSSKDDEKGGNSSPGASAPSETPNNPPIATAPAPPEQATASPTPLPPLSLADLTTSDYPASVTLLEPHQIPFKKGSLIALKDNAPLFFLSDYLRDGKSGDKMEVLKYDPVKGRVYCLSKDAKGNAIAVNLADFHATCPQPTTIPKGTEVLFENLIGDSLLVRYNDDNFLVPVSQTDLLQRATKQREIARSQAEQAAFEQAQAERQREQEAEEQTQAEQQAKAERDNQKKQQIQDEAGDKPENSAWDGSVDCVKQYLDAHANDPDIKYGDWYKPQLDKWDGKYCWLYG